MDDNTCEDEIRSLKEQIRVLEEEQKKNNNTIFWYESILDAIPFPVSVTDLDMNWTFLNKETEKMAQVDRKNATGTPCNRWKANICQTRDCGIETLRRGEKETFFEQDGGTFKVDVAYIKDSTGKNIGHIEVIQDITNIKHLEAEALDKAAWYESILNAIPFPVSVTDLNMNWTFLNLETAKMANVDRERAIGTQCNQWKANICKTRNCGIETLRRGEKQTFFEQDGGNFQVDVSYVKNRAGENVGHVEVIQDITANIRMKDYIQEEVNKAALNLDKIAHGNPDLKFDVAQADQYTQDAYDNFIKINQDIEKARDAIMAMVHDANELAEATRAGKINLRADVSHHEGAYRDVVAGVNDTLDALVNPMQEAMRVSTEYAKGNFTERFDEGLKVAGDITDFKNALDNIGVQVCNAIQAVNNQVEILVSNAEEANASIEEAASGTADIAKNTQSISANAEHGNEGIMQVIRAMDDFATTVAEVAANVDAVSKMTAEANGASQEGAQLAKDAEKGMAEISYSSSEVARLIDEVKSQMQEIGKIVVLITDIAAQTNLLALNAAIEAARAGDAGRGFAVVAAEVKALAEESRTSAGNIGDMIGNLQKNSDKAAQAMAESNKAVLQGSKTITAALASFEKIAVHVEDINTNIEMVASATEEQAAAVEQITSSATEVGKQVEMTAKDAMDIASASEEAAAAVDQVKEIVGNVNNVAENVSKEMSRFSIR